MKKTINIIMSVAAVVFGVVFAVTGIKTISEKDLYDTQITATVVDVQEEWESSADPEEPDRLVNNAYIDYEFDGKKYEHVPAPEQDDNTKVGDSVDILVQSKNPEKISKKYIFCPDEKNNCCCNGSNGYTNQQRRCQQQKVFR